MKNYIQIIAILGIVTSCFSVYPMEVKPNYYVIDPSTLRGTNPLSHTFCAKWKYDDGGPVPSFHSLHKKDEGLALMLTAVKIFDEPDNVKNKETLQTVRDAVRNGILVTSRFVSEASKDLFSFCVFRSENPTSIFTSVDDLFVNQYVNQFMGPLHSERVYKKRKWLEAVCQGYRERQKEVCNELIACGRGEEFKIEIPEGIAFLIFSYISEGALIEQAKKKFDDEQQAGPNLGEKLPRHHIPFWDR